jgi:hypothetical protein
MTGLVLIPVIVPRLSPVSLVVAVPVAIAIAVISAIVPRVVPPIALVALCVCPVSVSAITPMLLFRESAPRNPNHQGYRC